MNGPMDVELGHALVYPWKHAERLSVRFAPIGAVRDTWVVTDSDFDRGHFLTAM